MVEDEIIDRLVALTCGQSTERVPFCPCLELNLSPITGLLGYLRVMLTFLRRTYFNKKGEERIEEDRRGEDRIGEDRRDGCYAI